MKLADNRWMADPLTPFHAWALLVGFALPIVYELWISRRGRQDPQRVARRAHARLRATWVRVLGERAGFEIVAVQTLRNSLMSATITASTAALCMMGVVSSAGGQFITGARSLHGAVVRADDLLYPALLLVLFSSFVCSAFSMRYYNHAGFVVSMPAGSVAREQHDALAVRYVEQAGVLYGWGLRCFLLAAPLLAGLVAPVLMPVASAGLVIVLWLFDRPGPLEETAA